MRQNLRRRLDSYWRLELFCIVLLVGTALLFCAATGQWIGSFAVSCLFVMSVLLLVGASYWRAKLRQMNGDVKLLQTTLIWVERLHRPLLVAVIAILVLTASDFFISGISRNTIDRTVARLATLLSVLEYINYYHIQLQHFDHLPDLDRLLKGRGFRRSKMSNDLRRHRELKNSSG